MAIVKVVFDGGDVPIVTGVQPDTADTAIKDPTEMGGKTNHFFLVTAGVYCIGLKTNAAYTPLWQMGTAVDGVPLNMTFKKV